MLVLDMVFIVLLYQASLLRRNNIFFDTHCIHGTRNDDFFFQRVIFQNMVWEYWFDFSYLFQIIFSTESSYLILYVSLWLLHLRFVIV